MRSDAVAVNPEHARLLAVELQDLARQLQASAAAIAPPRPSLIRVK